MPEHITLPTSQEVREKLEKVGWEGNGDDCPVWYHSDGYKVDLSGEPTIVARSTWCPVISLTMAAQFAAIVGISPGYRLIPEDVAREWLEAQKALSDMLNDPKRDLDAELVALNRYHVAEEAIAEVLSPTPKEAK